MNSPQRDSNRWLTEHIPYRIRAGVCASRLMIRYGLESLDLQTTASGLCYHHAIHQGRMAAIRWLIEFIGIKGKRERGQLRAVASDAARNMRLDFGIGKLGAPYFPTEHHSAIKLAEVWESCARAVGHPTEGTVHDVEDETLASAMELILDHLERTIYAPPKRSMKDVLANTGSISNVVTSVVGTQIAQNPGPFPGV